jgi:hypothetical protein
MIDDEMTLIRSCLVMCLRRLRGYERQHVLAASGTASMVERQQAEQEAATDRALIELIEGTLRAHPTPLIPDPMAKAQNSG